MSSNRQVLVIDGNRVVDASIATLLSASGGYGVTQAMTLQDAEHVLASVQTEFDAIVMDVDSSSSQDGGDAGGDAIETCIRIRHLYADVAIILLSGSDDESLLVRGLAAGADDFIRKPFRASEIMARLQLRLRNLVKPDASATIGGFTFHPGKRLLVNATSNRKVHLPEKETKLLWQLHLGNGDVVSRVNLLHTVWSYNHKTSSHTVETHVYRLRQKIEADPSHPTLILTERGGYRLAVAEPARLATLSFPMPPMISCCSVL